MTKLGTTIRAKLRELGKTQVWLADELSVSNNAVSKWIATGKISRENSVAAAKLLEVSVEELLGEESKGERLADQPADELLKRASEMIEIYRLAGPADRERIDLVFSDVRHRLAAVDEAKTRTG